MAESSFKLVATLGIAGLVAGIAIVGIFEATKDTIAENKARELREAVGKVLPGSTTMKDVTIGDEMIAYAGYTADDQFVGWAVPAEGAGFQDTIKLLYGYNPAKTEVIGMEILDSRETPGLGDGIFKNKRFVNAFKSLSIDPEIVLQKTGASAANEIDAITGATISSKAVVKIINQTHSRWHESLSAEPEG